MSTPSNWRDVKARARARDPEWDCAARGSVESTAASAEPGAVVLLGLGVGRVRLAAPCRVVAVVDEPRRRGFAYGTLPGHPESGEERFTVSWGDDDRVELAIVAFSRPATWWARVAAPLTTRVQDRITDRYLVAYAAPGRR